MVDLQTTYLGLKLKNPLIAAASPLSEKVDTVRRLAEAGISAVVMYSLFEEQIIRESLELDRFLSEGQDRFQEALSMLPEMGRYSLSADKYLERLRMLKESTNIPIIGSLNGVSSGGWIRYAREIEQAGADALELNLYYLDTNPELTSVEVENNYLKLVQDIRASIKIPLAVKLSPFFTALPNIARRLAQAGANGLVLFNRFYQPDFDLERLDVWPSLTLSNSFEMRLPLHWIAILYGKVEADLALTTGVHCAEDALKAIMAGATAVMLASVLLKHGPGIAAEILRDMQAWMEAHEYQSITQMKGSLSQKNVPEPAAFERVNYIRTLNSFTPGIK